MERLEQSSNMGSNTLLIFESTIGPIGRIDNCELSSRSNPMESLKLHCGEEEEFATPMLA